MSKAMLICGKICSGKSYYARNLKQKEKAVILSTDEVTYDLINNEQGEFYDIFASRVNNYLKKKAVEIVKCGSNVILDWGFWTEEERKEISKYFESNNINYEWHYIDINDDTWHKNINERNERVRAGKGGSDFYVDEGLLKKVSSRFEKPAKEEINIWYRLER